MDTKKIRKSIGRFFGWIGLIFCSSMVRIIPPRCLYGFAKGIAAFGYAVAAKHRRIALESLTIAFGKEKSKEEIRRIAKDCFTLMAKGIMEVIYVMDRPTLMRKMVSFSGKEYLDGALSGGRGVILVSAHFGNFPLMLGKLSVEGYKVASIMRHMRDERVEKIFLAKRNRLGLKTIYSQPRKQCVEETIRSLRNNELVFIPLDQNFGTAGVFVDFFGKKAATATGPVILARRTKAVILPCFIIRQDDDRHKIIFEPPLVLEEGRTEQEAMLINVQRLTSIIESFIRKYPAEWGWIHRRWKSTPVS